MYVYTQYNYISIIYIYIWHFLVCCLVQNFTLSIAFVQWGDTMRPRDVGLQDVGGLLVDELLEAKTGGCVDANTRQGIVLILEEVMGVTSSGGAGMKCMIQRGSGQLTKGIMPYTV